MRIAIMQPYFFPYVGYFQLMDAADEFVVYDNIEYTKKGWINRNRILVNGKDVQITLPLKKDSDYLNIKDRFLSDIWPDERNKMLNKIKEAYRKAPYFVQVFPIIENVVLCEEKNLFKFILNSIEIIKSYLDIKTPLIISSTIEIDHNLKSENKVLAICRARKADIYLNPIGGTELYNKAEFKKENVKLEFHKTDDIVYKQFDNDFIPFMSIVDVMMFNPKEKIREYLKAFSVIK